MFTHNLNPVLAELGPLQIRYYGLFYVIGFIVAYFMLQAIARKRSVTISNNTIEDLLFYVGLFGILGSRLLYVFVYNPAFYFSNPSEILALWHGGLSFHGGFIGGVLGMLYFSKKYRYRFTDVADMIVIPVSFALGLGRIGNFINGELYGRITDVSWCVNFPDVLGCRHPSPLYESFYSFVIFSVLWQLRGKKLKSGMLFGLFMLLYSVFRFVAEFFREADVQLGYFYGLTMGQLLNIVLFAAGVLFIKHINGSKR